MYTSHTVQDTVSRQRGVALVIALVFLLMLTIIGVTAMSTTVLQEKMAGNMKDKNAAFQAAESALVAGEIWLRPLAVMPVFDTAVTDDGLHLPSTTGKPVWHESTGIWSTTDVVDYTELPGSAALPSGQFLNHVNKQPKYLIEDLGPVRDPLKSLKLGTPSPSTRNLFRITARGTGGTDQAVATVQSVFEKSF